MVRAVLVQKLDIEYGKIALLIGPPGSGKTLLMAARYAEQSGQGRPVHWLSLANEDNDVAALQRHLAQAFALPVNAGLPDAPPGIDGFIDGLECLDDPAAQKLLERFVLSLPDTTRFYLTSTRQSGVALHRGRLSGVVEVIGPQHLRMSNDEAAMLLAGQWSPFEVVQLNRFVDGWAAGLRFLGRDAEAARRVLERLDDLATPPAEMTCYFDDMVCADMAPDVLSALMVLSVFEQFPPALLADMPDAPCSWALVEAHVRSGLFMRFHDDGSDWVVFHGAFGRHLRQRLRRLDPARHDALKYFAANWFERNGFAGEAVRHAVAIRETPVAARIIESSGAIGVDMADGPDVSLEKYIPPSRAGELPLLFIAQIYRRIRMGRQLEAKAAFEAACVATDHFSRLHPEADVAEVQSWAHIFEVVFLTTEDVPVPERHITTFEANLKAHLGSHPVLAASIASVLAFLYLDRSRYAEAAAVCNIGLHAQGVTNENKASIFLRLHQAGAALALETLDKAVMCVEHAMRLAAIQGRPDSYEVLTSQIMRGVMYYENNELDRARQLLAPALEQVRIVNGWVRLYAEGFATLAAIVCMQDGLEAAESVLRAGEAFARERDLPRLIRFLAIARLRERTRAGEWRQARAVMESEPLVSLVSARCNLPHDWVQQVPAQLAVARLLVELQRLKDAQAMLDRIDKAFLEDADSRLRFAFRVLSMRVAHGLRRYGAAVEHMQEAADLARHAGLARRALRERNHLIEVFDWAQRNGRALPARVGAWIEGTLRAADGSESGDVLQQISPRRSGLRAVNSILLSPRESEVILLMAEGCINKEIASRLGISEGTVKVHRKKIHEKLGVSSRSQALMRARELLII